MAKFVTLDQLKAVTQSILKYMDGGKPSAVNICPQCGALITSEDMVCEYCGAKLKLVTVKKKEEQEK